MPQSARDVRYAWTGTLDVCALFEDERLDNPPVTP